MSQKYDSLGNKINIQVDYNAGVSTGGNTAGTTGMATRQIVLVGLGALSLSQSLGAGYGTISFSVPNQSAQSLGFYGSSQTTGQSSSSSFDARSITLVGQGIVSVGMSAGSILISATEVAQTVQTIGIYASSQTTGQSSSSTIDARSLSVVGMGNISVGLSAGSLLISGAGGGGTLTLFASSNTTGQSSSTTVNVTSVMFRGMGIASVGYSVGEIIISVPSGGGVGDGGNVLAAGTRTATTLGTVLFSNSNGISFGLDAVNGSIMTASFSESVQTIGLYASSQTTGQSSSSTVDARSISLVGQGIVSVGLSGGSLLISATQSAQAASASNGSFTFQTLNFSNGTNITFATSAGGIIAASVNSQSVQTIGLYASSQTTGQSSSSTVDARSISLVGQGLASVGLSGGSFLISVTAPAQTNQTIGMYASSQTTGQSSSSTVDARSITFVGQGIVSVGLSGGSYLISASSNQSAQTVGLYASSQTTGQSSSSTVDARSVTFVGMGIASVGLSNGSYLISVPSGGGGGDGGNVLAAGTRTATTLGTVLFSNANNFTWGLDAVNGSVMTASFSESVQTIGLYASSQTTGQSSSSTVDARSITLVGQGGISVGLSNGSFLISQAGGGGGPAISAAGASASNGTIVFSNSNNVSFGMAGSTITATITVPAQTVQSIGLYASSQTTGQSSSSTVDARSITFVGGGIVSVGLSGGSYLISATQVAQSVQSLAIYASSQTYGQSSSSTYDARSLSMVGSGGVSVGWSLGSLLISGQTTAAQTVQTLGLYASSQTTGQSSSSTVDARSITFVGAGNISVGLSGGSYYISATNAQSVQTIGLYASSQTTGQSSSSTVDARSISFVGQGIVSVGLSGGSYLISATTVAQTVQTIGLYASSQTTGQSSSSTVDARSISFVGQGIVSVGLSGGSYLISATQSNQAASASNGSFTFQTLNFSNGNNVTFGTSAGGIISASVLAQTVQSIGLYASSQTTGQSSSSTVDARSITFVGQGIVSVGLSGGSYLISATTAQSVQSIGLYASSQTTGQSSSSTVDARSITFVGQGIVSVGLSGGSYLVSATQSVQTIGMYASSQTTGQSSSSTVDARSMTFVGAGIISVGLSGGSYIISATGGGAGGNITAYATSNTTQSSTGVLSTGSMIFAGAGIASVGISNGSVVISVPAGGGAGMSLGMSTQGNTAGTTGFVSNNYQLVGSGAITMSQSVNGQSATMTVIGPATSSLVGQYGIGISTNGSTISVYNPPQAGHHPYDDLMQVVGQVGQGTLQIDPQPMPAVAFDRLLFKIQNTNSSNSSGSHTISVWVGLYTRDASTLSLYWSGSGSTAVTHSGTAGSYSLYSGGRVLPLTVAATTIAADKYWIAVVSRTTSGGANGTYSNYMVSNINSAYSGLFGQSTNATQQPRLGQGYYSVTTSGMPSSIAFSQINGTASLAIRMPIIGFGSGTA